MTDITILAQWALDKFWLDANPRDGDECWIWSGSAKNGRAIIPLPARERIGGAARLTASHVALIIDGRPRPAAPNHLAIHGDCSNPLCVNPGHLRWGSHRENMADRARLGRGADFRGVRSPRSRLTVDDLEKIWVDPRRYKAIAADFGCSESVISHIKTKRKYHGELALIEARFGEAVKPPHSSVRI